MPVCGAPATPPARRLPACLPACLQKRDAAKRELQELQQARQEDEGPLAARQQLLETLKKEKQQVDTAIRANETKMTGGAAGGGGGRAGARGGQASQQQPGLEDVVYSAVGACVLARAFVGALLACSLWLR
jgi:hypothetical protein